MGARQSSPRNMKTLLLVAALSATVASQATTADIPSCALQCLVTAITQAGCSDPTDTSCSCPKTDDIAVSATPCILQACSQDDALKTQTVTQEICAAAGSGENSSAAPSAAPTTMEPASSGGAAPTGETPTSTQAMSQSGSPTSTPPPADTGAAGILEPAGLMAGVLAVAAVML